MVNRKDLNETDLALLEEIVSSDPADLTEYQIGCLTSRRDYLTRDEKELYAEALSGKLEGKDVLEARKVAKAGREANRAAVKAAATKKAREVKEDIEAGLDPKDAEFTIDPEDYDVPTLTQMVKDAGAKVPNRATKAQLAELLNAR